MPGDARDHPVPSLKTAPPAHPDETSESPAPYRPVLHRARPTSEKSLPAISKIQNPPPAKIFPVPRNTHPMPAIPRPATRPARQTNYCQSCSARPRPDSASSAACSRRAHGPPASASRHLHRQDAPPPASAAPSCPAAAMPAATLPFPDPAAVPPAHPNTQSVGPPTPQHLQTQNLPQQVSSEQVLEGQPSPQIALRLRFARP